jgi:hypothetical protein
MANTNRVIFDHRTVNEHLFKALKNKGNLVDDESALCDLCVV